MEQLKTELSNFSDEKKNSIILRDKLFDYLLKK
jgi:hypothetical protein